MKDKDCGNLFDEYLKTCGNCDEYRASGKCWDDHLEKDLACEGWVLRYSDLLQLYKALKSQLAKHKPHPFDPEDRGTWPEEYKELIVFGGGISQIGVFHRGNFTDRRGNRILCIWWSYLPGEE